MKNWWRKWSYEIPLAFGDALWEVLVVQFADFLSRLTVRRVLEFVAVALLVMAFAQTLPIDLALLFAGDTVTYLELLLIIRLTTGKEHFLHLLHLAIRSARFATLVVRIAIDRPVNGINKWRERRTPARRTRPRISDRSDDADGFGAAWGAFATA